MRICAATGFSSPKICLLDKGGEILYKLYWKMFKEMKKMQKTFAYMYGGG